MDEEELIEITKNTGYLYIPDDGKASIGTVTPSQSLWSGYAKDWSGYKYYKVGDRVRVLNMCLPTLNFVHGGESYFREDPKMIGTIKNILNTDTSDKIYHIEFEKTSMLMFTTKDMIQFTPILEKNIPDMKQFIDKTKHYPGGTKVVYVGSNLSEQTMKDDMYPLLEKGRHYTLYFDKQANHDWICLIGILQEDDHEESCRLSLNTYSFMEIEENDYDIVKENPERMKEFAKTALQYILNNPRIYYAIKTNMEYLAKEKEFNEHLEKDI
jgi:hypothetical protein